MDVRRATQQCMNLILYQAKNKCEQRNKDGTTSQDILHPQQAKQEREHANYLEGVTMVHQQFYVLVTTLFLYTFYLTAKWFQHFYFNFQSMIKERLFKTSLVHRREIFVKTGRKIIESSITFEYSGRLVRFHVLHLHLHYTLHFLCFLEIGLLHSTGQVSETKTTSVERNSCICFSHQPRQSNLGLFEQRQGSNHFQKRQHRNVNCKTDTHSSRLFQTNVTGCETPTGHPV